jgi:hypothetical protein
VGSLDSIKEDLIVQLGIGEYKSVEKSVALLLEKNGIEGVEMGAAAYVTLCREVLRAQLQGIEIEKGQMSSGFVDTLEASVTEQLPSVIQPSHGGGKSLLISEAIDRYADETKTNWRDKTEENLAILNFFKRVVGDIPIQSVTRKTVGEFKQTLRKLPPNINKKPKYREYSGRFRHANPIDSATLFRSIAPPHPGASRHPS